MQSDSKVTSSPEIAPAEYNDPVIEHYKRDVDRTLLRANLQLSVAQRFEQFASFAAYAKELHDAGERSRASNESPGKP